MQFEDFDKKVKEAADHYYPSYDENAWEKMEKLLNKHLPQKGDDRRRFFFILLFILLLGGGGWLFLSKPWQSKPTLTEKTTAKDQIPVSGNSIATEKPIDQPLTGKEEPEAGKSVGVNKEETVTIPLPVIHRPLAGEIKENTSRWMTTKKNVPAKNTKESEGKRDNPVIAGIDQNNDPVKDGIDLFPVSNSVTNLTPTISSSQDKTGVQKSVENTDKKPEQAATVTKKSNEKSKAGSAFFFTLSAGPDISALGTKSGQTKLLAGAGIGYTFNNIFTLRTGFYSSRKVYTASPGDYKPTIPVPNGAYLNKIDADCKVYEIPLILSYNFNRSVKNNWFGSAGLSSYLMNRETYDYEYEYPGSQPFVYSHTYKNENHHYFSVLSLSAGYTKHFNKRIFLTAEPYVKIPLKGVGNGNVKLNSAGILLSVGIKPFAPADKR